MVKNKKKYITIIPLYFLCLGITQFAASFVWDFYAKQHLPNQKHKNFIYALQHFMSQGIKRGYNCSPCKIYNTNFDYTFYKNHNNLPDLNTEQEAFFHYTQIGHAEQLPYCKKHAITFCLHLGNISHIDKLVKKINHCIANNPCNEFSIYISIPILDHNHLLKKIPLKKYIQSDQLYAPMLKTTTLHHAHLITENIAPTLYALDEYIKDTLAIPKDRIHIILIENRGLDIGGFLLQVEKMIQNNDIPDFIIKIHTKTDPLWAEMLFSILNIKLNHFLTIYDAAYTCKFAYPDEAFNHPHLLALMEKVKQITNTPTDFPSDYNFCGGTMFIAKGSFITYMKDWDFKKLFDLMPIGKPNRITICHAFERYFGGIIDYLGMRVCHLGYYPTNTPTVFGEADANL